MLSRRMVSVRYRLCLNQADTDAHYSARTLNALALFFFSQGFGFKSNIIAQRDCVRWPAEP